MKIYQLKESLRKLNYAQLGSLGEYIYTRYAKARDLSVSSVHDSGVDYIVNGVKVDVKSKRLLNYRNIPKTLIPKSDIEDIIFHYVLFLRDFIVICDDQKKILYKARYEPIVRFFQEWNNNHQIPLGGSRQRRRLPPTLKKEIKEFFGQKGKGARIIYRTIIDRWGKDAPHNLKPKEVKADNVTVYLAFQGHKLNLNEIAYIIAFPDEDSVNFPLLKSPRMSNEKVDISKLSNNYKFRTVKDLFSEFFNRFSNNVKD